MSHIKTIHVPHLDGIDVGYQMPRPYDIQKPTIVLVNSFATSSELYKAQFADQSLVDAANLLAIDLLGHGNTRTESQHWTYWDTAIMNLQVLEALNISGAGKKVFVLGTSQGGWITARMALLAPDKIHGIVPLGTSMDYESEQSRSLGCWNCHESMTPSIDAWTTDVATPEFALDGDYCEFLVDVGFGKGCSTELRKFWVETMANNYKGDAGRRRLRMAAINLRDRDGLHGRLSDVRVPVLWIHGTEDVVYSVAHAQEEIKRFVKSPAATVKVVQGGPHYLSATHPEVVNPALLEFVKKWT